MNPDPEQYPVGKDSFLLFEYNTHFSCPPLKMFRGGKKIFALRAKYFPHNKMSSCAPDWAFSNISSRTQKKS